MTTTGPDAAATDNVTRQVVVLFTDLVELAALSGPGDERRREHFALLRRAIAGTDGTEVKHLGDGLMVVFPTASAALACGVAMQQAVEADQRGRESALGLRVGISAGDAVEENGDYFGTPVVEAARLCARAEPGQTLAADVVRLIAGKRNPHPCVPVGALELKGLPDPVDAVEVVWEPATTAAVSGGERVPLPSRLARRPASGLLGRAQELATLRDAWKRVAAGDGREVVVVAGEAGLGKTTLVADVAGTAYDAGACVLFGHADEGLSTPYGLFAEALGHLVTHASDDDVRAYVAEGGADLARIVPALSRRLPDVAAPISSDAETERYLLFAAVVGLVRHAAATRPLVLVLDDLQWADTASLQLLRYVLAEDPVPGLFVLGTYRDTEVGAGHPLGETLAALWRMDRVARIELRGLDDRAVVDLVEATAGGELDDAGVGLAHALHRETDGNPFFVEELIRNLVETGAVQRDASGRWVSDVPLDGLRLPDSVREVIGVRVGRLDADAARILSTAAVIGRDFDLELLARATDRDADQVLDVLEAAEQAALVREPATVAGRFAFTHALIQRTLYQDLSPSRRARTHERVAEALEDLTAGRPGDRVGELAHHWARAVRPTDTAKAVDYAAQAGHRSLGQLAPAEAVRWFGQALELIGADADPRRRAELLVGLGDAQLQTGDPAHRDTLLEAAALADAADDVELLVAAALTNSRGMMSTVGETDHERLAAIERALVRLGDRDPATRAWLLSLAAVEQIYSASLDARLALVEEAVTLARATDDLRSRAMALSTSTFAVSVPSTVDARVEWASAAAAAADEIGDPAVRYRTRDFLRVNLLEAADRDGVDRQTEVIGEILSRLPNATLHWNASLDRAWLAFLDGDLDLGRQYADDTLAVGLETGQPDAFTFYSAQVANLYECGGRFGELVELVEEAVEENPGLPAFRSYLGFALAEAGDLDRCREVFGRDRDAGFVVNEDNTWASAHMFWSKTAIAVRDHAAAAVLHDRLAPYPDRVITAQLTVSPVIGHYVGRLAHLLGRLDDADSSFARALDVHARLRAPQFVARTQVRWSQALVDRGRDGDRPRAIELAERARAASADRSGWGWIERDAGEVLDRLR